MDYFQDHGRLKDSCTTKNSSPAEVMAHEGYIPRVPCTACRKSLISPDVATTDMTTEELCEFLKFQGLPEICELCLRSGS